MAVCLSVQKESLQYKPLIDKYVWADLNALTAMLLYGIRKINILFAEKRNESLFIFNQRRKYHTSLSESNNLGKSIACM